MVNTLFAYDVDIAGIVWSITFRGRYLEIILRKELYEGERTNSILLVKCMKLVRPPAIESVFF